jgi:hypothetical protein
MFTNAKLNIWENQWSEFQDFSKDSENVTYFNIREDLDFVEKFTNSFKDQETDIFGYYPVLFTAGLSYSFNEEYEVKMFKLEFIFILQRNTNSKLQK